MTEVRDSEAAKRAGSLLADLSAESYVSLALWIEEATRGLCDDARKRIGAEIESHYADAYEHYRELGYADIQAQNAAVAAMGSPRRARRAFGRSYLTKKEAQALDDLRAPKRGPLLVSLLLFLFSLAFMANAAGYRGGNAAVFLFGGFCFWLSYFVLVFVWVPHLVRQGRPRTATAALFVGAPCLALGFLWFLGAFFPLPPFAPFCVFLGLFLLVVLKRWRVLATAVRRRQ